MKDIASIKTSKNYTTEELYQEIKDCSFTAGKPEYKEVGILKSIKLPAVGRYEDVAQTETFIANSMISSKLGIFSKALDKDKKPSQELLVKTTEELKGFLGL